MTISGPQPSTQSSKHRLVALGDSLTHGFQSFAIYNTDLSYPALIAERLGIKDSFRYPRYKPLTDPYGSNAPGGWGPPINLEFIARKMEEYDCRLVAELAGLLDDIREYWDQQTVEDIPDGDIMHNLAVAGYDVRDLFERTADTERQHLHRWSLIDELPWGGPFAKNAGPMMGLKVLNSARDPISHSALTPVQAAQALGEDGGIETLIVFVGANNALRTVIDLRIDESGAGFDSLEEKGRYNLWRPEHFSIEMGRLMERVKDVNARHVLWATVPHVTIAPLAHGIGGRLEDHPQYFQYYTYPWIPDDQFNPDRDHKLTGAQVMYIDGHIDLYNDTIRAGVEEANRGGNRDWHVVDVCALMDRFAYRRYWEDERLEPIRKAKLPNDTRYPLPQALAELPVPPDSRFFESGPNGRRQGGLIALDGVHPTTIGYGLMGQEFMRVMRDEAKVDLSGEAGRNGGDLVDFKDLLARDELVSNPPKCVTADLQLLMGAQVKLDWVLSLGHVLCTSPVGRLAALGYEFREDAARIMRHGAAAENTPASSS